MWCRVSSTRFWAYHHFVISSTSTRSSRLSVTHFFLLNVRLFGIQVTPTPPVLKALPKIFSHNDKTVRAEGTLLTHALYCYLGPGIEPWLADLKPVQVKELKEAFDTMEKEGKGRGSLKRERLTRAQAREAEERAALGEVSTVDQPQEGTAIVLCSKPHQTHAFRRFATPRSPHAR